MLLNCNNACIIIMQMQLPEQYNFHRIFERCHHMHMHPRVPQLQSSERQYGKSILWFLLVFTIYIDFELPFVWPIIYLMKYVPNQLCNRRRHLITTFMNTSKENHIYNTIIKVDSVSPLHSACMFYATTIQTPNRFMIMRLDSCKFNLGIKCSCYVDCEIWWKRHNFVHLVSGWLILL